MLELRHEGAVRVLTLACEKSLDAFNGALFDALVEGLLDAQADDEVAVAVITGKGRAFTAGAEAFFDSALIIRLQVHCYCDRR